MSLQHKLLHKYFVSRISSLRYLCSIKSDNIQFNKKGIHTVSNSQENRNGNGNNNKFKWEYKFGIHRCLKYLSLLASGYVTYKLINNDKSIIPSVSASQMFLGNTLSGRRKQFNFIADVVETTAPAVVYIEIKDSRRTHFFSGKPVTISNGSGFIIRQDGLILTNAHVVTSVPYSKVEVKLYDGSLHNGVVEDVDMTSDLATVRINAKNLPVLKLGDSSSLRPGEFVVAMGSPLSLNNTVTSGVISTPQRGAEELGLHDRDMVYIQTDAAITFGNSGGPLVNLDGEAIGVNSMKVTAGISFAIPSDYVKEFLKNAQNSSKVVEPKPKRLYMGITMVTLTPQLILEMKQRNQYVPPDIQSGVLVWKVILGSPAHNGGLQPGDIVTHIDGKVVKSAKDIYAFLAETKSRTLTMTVVRLGKKLNVYVTPEDLS